MAKGHPVSEVPFLGSEQSHQQNHHRSQLWVNEAPQAQTIASATRLAGFEIEKHDHVFSPSLCTRVPYGSRLRTLGQQVGVLIFRCDPPTRRGYLGVAGRYRPMASTFKTPSAKKPRHSGRGSRRALRAALRLIRARPVLHLKERGPWLKLR